ncbi:PspC domain-containing protein, partial [Leucobacter soli]
MTTTTPLVRSREDRLLGGVCAGLAMHLGLPVVWVRGGMLVFALFGGAGAIFYVWLWVTVPRDTGDLVPPMRRALTRPGPPAAAASGADSASVPAAPFVSGGGPIASGSASMSAVPASAVAAAPAVRNDDLAAEGAASPSAVPVAGPVPGSSPASHPSSPSGALPDDAGARSRQRWPVAELLLGGALLIAGIGLVLAQIGIGVDLGLVLPGMVVLVGVGLAWWQIADRDRPERHQLPRVLGALGLVAVGVLTFFVTARQPSALTVIAAALAVLA